MSCECEDVVEAEFKACASCETKKACEEKGACKTGYKAEEASVCAPDEELINGTCQKISVTLECDIESMNAIVEASNG